MSVLEDASIRESMRQAWLDSNSPGDSHEEGGFILRSTDGTLIVERWPRGLAHELDVPEHPNGKRGDLLVVATFHTHPFSKFPWSQAPSRGDRRAVRDDGDLSHDEYKGEYVISQEWTYLVYKSGSFDIVGTTKTLFNL